jgi:hypothetical protein
LSSLTYGHTHERSDKRIVLPNIASQQRTRNPYGTRRVPWLLTRIRSDWPTKPLRVGSHFFHGAVTEREIVMATFLITYHGGGGMPESAEARDQMMAAFQAWAASVGEAMIDPGSPLGPRKTVTSDGVADAAADDTLGGYTLIKAESLDDAVDAVKGHPFVARGGTLQVSRAVSP